MLVMASILQGRFCSGFFPYVPKQVPLEPRDGAHGPGAPSGAAVGFVLQEVHFMFR